MSDCRRFDSSGGWTGPLRKVTVSGFGIGLLLGAALVVSGSAPARAASCYSIARAPGDAGNDTFNDPSGWSSTWDAGGGDDTANMDDCFDIVYGGPGSDEIRGQSDGDVLHGEGGDDRPGDGGGIYGGPSSDALYGELGNDYLDDDQGTGDDDGLFGGDGNNDVLTAVDGDGSDGLHGGAGDSDKCTGDNGDSTPNCEQ